MSINEVATSNLFGLLRYLFCLNCFSNSSSCCDVKAVLGLLVFPRRACWAAQPVDDKYIWIYLTYLAHLHERILLFFLKRNIVPTIYALFYDTRSILLSNILICKDIRFVILRLCVYRNTNLHEYSAVCYSEFSCSTLTIEYNRRKSVLPVIDNVGSN